MLAIVRTLYIFNELLAYAIFALVRSVRHVDADHVYTPSTLRALVTSSAQMDNHRGSVDTVSIASSFMSAADATSMGMRDPSFDLGGMRAAFKTNSSFV